MILCFLGIMGNLAINANFVKSLLQRKNDLLFRVVSNPEQDYRRKLFPNIDLSLKAEQ
jgi:hypothetical protein